MHRVDIPSIHNRSVTGRALLVYSEPMRATHELLVIVRESSNPCICTSVLVGHSAAYEDIDARQYREGRRRDTDGV